MGGDSHLYAEWRRSSSDNWFTLACDWEGWRDYGTFGRLAGVRRDDLSHIPPRGVPLDLTYDVHNAYFDIIDWRGQHDGESGWVSRNEAEARIARGEKPFGEVRPHTWTSIAIIHNPFSGELPQTVKETRTFDADIDGKPLFLRQADWHSASWLTGPEYRAALQGGDFPTYHALGQAMLVLEERSMETRVVFWFDN